MKIAIGIEDKGLVLGPLISNRAHDALRQGCVISTSEIEGTDGRINNVVVSNCQNDQKKECYALCMLLADIIVENLQVRHMVQLLKHEYDFLSEKEQCDILVNVLKSLWYGMAGEKNDVALCKNEVRRRLYDVILDNETSSIMLEGFMRFRMKDYLAVWEKELAHTVEQYIRKKEYVEFVEILRLFVNVRIPRVRKVHVCVGGDGDYILFDEKMCLLKCKFIGASIDKDDALLSTLVNIAPLCIVVHNRDKLIDARILETIKDVFGRRVEFSEDMV